jgi:hypothetical protein
MNMIGAENPEERPTGWFSHGEVVREFDSVDNASVGHDALLDEIESAGRFGD